MTKLPRYNFRTIPSQDVVGGMVTLFQKIRHSVIRNEYLIGFHVAERLEQRGIMEWQAVEGLIGGSLLEERPDARPNALVEVLQVLPDGTEFKAVWAYLTKSETAKLVTVHFFDGCSPWH